MIFTTLFTENLRKEFNHNFTICPFIQNVMVLQENIFPISYKVIKLFISLYLATKRKA